MEDQEASKIEVPSKIQDAISRLSKTDDGREFFRYLMRQCSFHVSTIVGNPQSHDINVHGTLFNEARRRLYLDLRRHIPHAERRKIEN